MRVLGFDSLVPFLDIILSTENGGVGIKTVFSLVPSFDFVSLLALPGADQAADTIFGPACPCDW